jgi:plastocyanin
MTRTLIAAFVAALTLAVPATSLAAPAPATAHVDLTIKSDTEHGKKGADGKWHDAYLPAKFTIHSGQTVVVTIHNYDDAYHTFTAKRLGLNVVVRGGSATKPSVTTFTFRAGKPGTYLWHCLANCDGWAMDRVGFMAGRVTVVA